MAYSIELANRIREALKGVENVEEKKMFGGLAFLVNGKMCLTAGAERMMCRVDPEMSQNAIQKGGCSTVVMGGREYNQRLIRDT